MLRTYKFIFLIFILESRKFVEGQSELCSEKAPLCVDKHKVLVKSNCVKGKWSQGEQCEMEQRPFVPKCLPGDDIHAGYCIHIRGPQQWSHHIPVYDVEILNLYNIKEIVQNYLETKERKIFSFWLPARRLETYGKITWTLPKYYHSNYQLQLEGSAPDLVSNDCVLFSNLKSMKIEDCKKKYHSIHIYKPESRYFTRTTAWHFSTSNTNGYYIEKKCKYLAEPKTREDNFIIKRLVEYENLKCRIGVERNINGTFVWSSSKTPLNFTDWMSSTNFDNENTTVVITSDGWTFNSSANDVNCSVCQVDYSKYKIDVSLSLNENKTLIVMTQYSSHIIKSIALRTIGLEDIRLKSSFTEIEVYNDYKDTENEFEKLNRRMSWYVNSSLSLSNEYYFDYILLPEVKEKKTAKIFLPRKDNILKLTLKAEIKKICLYVVCDPNINFNLYKNISKFCTETLSEIFEHNVTVTIMKILDINKHGNNEILLHLQTNYSHSIAKYYDDLEKKLKKIFKYLVYKYKSTDYNISFKSLKCATACLSKESNKNNCTFKWEITNISNTYSAECKNRLHGNLENTSTVQQFAIRKCEGNFIDGAEWGKIKYLNSSEKTDNIIKVFNKLANISASVAVKELSNVIATTSNIQPLGLHFISAIFKNISHSTDEIQDKDALAKSTSVMINNLLASNIASKEEPDIVVRSANNMLQNIEKILPQITSNKINENGTYIIVEDNFIHAMINPFIQGISGIALIKPNHTISPSFKNYEIQYLHTNTTIKHIKEKENLEIATFVPYRLFDNIRNYSNETARIAVNIFYNDTLFLSTKTQNESSKPLTKIIDVSISNYNRVLFSPLPIISKTNATSCGYWDFGTVTDMESKWINENDWISTHDNSTSIQICNFSHLTNFAMLIGKQVVLTYSENTYDENTGLNSEDISNLEIITILGSLLSGIGISGIYLTAFVFKSWRHMIGSKVVLNICGCILLQIVLLHSNTTDSDLACVISGSLLHYVVLCGFSWSLVMAVLHYLKFVKVIRPQTPHLLLKAAVVGWMLPVFPVAVAVTYNYSTYGYYISNLKQLGPNICYPQGIVMYLSLLLPVTLIVCANIVIFFIVLYNVAWRPKIRNTLNEKKLFIQKIKLAVFLFFLLGMTWIFGLFADLFDSIILTYLFTLTASLQGFVLFLFYVIFDQKTRNLWHKKLQSARLSQKFSILSRETETNIRSQDEVEMTTHSSVDWTIQVSTLMTRITSPENKNAFL